MLLTVTEMQRLEGYRLRLTFNIGVVKEIDLSAHWDHLFGPVFQALRDPHFFSQASLPKDSETIEWPNGADLAAEFLYEIGETVAIMEPAVVRASK
jgi:hypothetical protein